MTKRLPWKEYKSNFNIESTKNEILKKAKIELTPIQDNLAEKKITVDEAKSELKKINEWLKWSKLETEDKKEVWKAFEKLINLEKNIDENALKNEVNEIVQLLEILTKKNLANLKHTVIRSKKFNEIQNRPPEVQKWIKESSLALDSTISDASQDSNPIANRAGKMMKRLNS